MRDGKPVYLDAMIKKVDRYKDLFIPRRQNDRRERHSHKAVSENSESIQAGRHNQCLPALSANRRGYHWEKQEIRTPDRLRSKVRISYVWWT